MKSSRSIKSRTSKSARSEKSLNSKGSMNSVESVVSVSPSAAPSALNRRSTRTRSMMKRQGTEQEMKKQLALKKRFDAEFESKMRLFEQLQAKLDQQEAALALLQEGMRSSKSTHDRRVAALKAECLLVRSRTVDCQDRVSDKESIVEANILEIKEWKEVANSDEVRRAYNFILSRPNRDILGVLPEEVFSEESMSTFYSCKQKIRCDKRGAVLLRKAAHAAASAACLCIPVLDLIFIGLREEQKFKRAVMRSVGVKEVDMDAAWVFRSVIEQVKNSKQEADNAGSAVLALPHHWRKYRIQGPHSPTPPTTRPTGVQHMLAQCRAALHTLEGGESDGHIGSSALRGRNFKKRRDKEFERERSLPIEMQGTGHIGWCGAEELPMHTHLPDAYANLPVRSWVG